MNPDTRDRLRRLNRRFYEAEADAFDASRRAPWEGWRTLLELLRPGRSPLDVLDAGCGNGRLARFLLGEHLAIRYWGLDVSLSLLGAARSRLPRHCRWLALDLALDAPSTALEDRAFDLVTLYGVLHHVPGSEERRRLLADLATLVRNGGHLAFSLWQWKEHPRLAKRIVAWDAELPVRELLGSPCELDLEPDDHLLRWGRSGRWLRYCHHFGRGEGDALVASVPLRLVSDTVGEGGLNRYLVMRRDEARE